MELDTYILIGEAIIYIISCTINFVIFYKMHKSTSTKLDEIIRKSEPIIQSQTSFTDCCKSTRRRKRNKYCTCR